MIVISADNTILTFSRDHPACAVVPLGFAIMFVTSASSYQTLTAAAIDQNTVDYRKVNVLTGPVHVQDAEPGDALGVTVDAIAIEGPAYAPYIPKWRSRSFDIPSSIAPRYDIRGNAVELSDTIRLSVDPMIGCLGVAPSVGEVSALSPASPTGGNLDLVELKPGATIWFPVMVPGALFALGDLHARMGRGEPAGVGLECAGSATVRFSLRRSAQIGTPIIETKEIIGFVGTARSDYGDAEQTAVSAAYSWLKARYRLEDEIAFGVAAALLDVNFGGPAGANVVAAFSKHELARAGLKEE